MKSTYSISFDEFHRTLVLSELIVIYKKTKEKNVRSQITLGNGWVNKLSEFLYCRTFSEPAIFCSAIYISKQKISMLCSLDHRTYGIVEPSLKNKLSKGLKHIFI